MSVSEVADLLSVDTATVRRRIAAGDLRGLKLGDTPNAPVRIPSSDVAAFLRRAAERQRERAVVA